MLPSNLVDDEVEKVAVVGVSVDDIVDRVAPIVDCIDEN